MDIAELLPQTIKNLSAQAGALMADCAIKDAAIEKLNDEVRILQAALAAHGTPESEEFEQPQLRLLDPDGT